EFHVYEVIRRVPEHHRVGMKRPRAAVVVGTPEYDRQAVSLIHAVGGDSIFAGPAAKGPYDRRSRTGFSCQTYRLGGAAGIVPVDHLQSDVAKLAGRICLIDRELERIVHSRAVIDPGTAQRKIRGESIFRGPPIGVGAKHHEGYE